MPKISKAPETGAEQAERAANTWTVPKGGENTVFARIQYRQFNQQTGQRMFKPRVVTWEKTRDWPNFLGDTQGYEILEVLHLPEGAISPDDFYAQKAEQAQKEAERLNAQRRNSR